MYSQLLLKSETRYYSQGTIIADSREEAQGLYVITSGQVSVGQSRGHIALFFCSFVFDVILGGTFARLEQKSRWTQTMLILKTRMTMAVLCYVSLKGGEL